jgi:hypothetical protein
MFQWLFGNVMPNLVGIDVLRHVRIVITDGDSQETSQLDVAMSTLMPEALEQDVSGMWLIAECARSIQTTCLQN